MSSELRRDIVFVSRIRGKRDPFKLSAEAFNAEVLRRHGSGDFTLQEYLCSASLPLCCFYDWDGKFDREPSPAEISALFKSFLKDLELLHPGKVPRFGKRHGWVTVRSPEGRKDGKNVKEGEEKKPSPKKYKVSFRAWFPEVVVNAIEDIPAHVRNVLKIPAKGMHENIDLSVYKGREQLLVVIGGCKDIDEEKRFLVPIDSEGAEIPWDQVTPAEYLAQNPFPDAEVLPAPSSSSGARAKGKGKGKGSATSCDQEADGKQEETVIFTNSDDEAKDALSAATDFFGEKYRMHEELQTVKVDREKSCLIFQTRQRWCWISRKTHAGNNPYITITDAGARFKCPDEACIARGDIPLIPLGNLPDPVRTFFTKMFYSHVDAELMSSACQECKMNIVENFPEEKEEAFETAPYKDMLTTLAKHQTCRKCQSGRMQFEHTLKGWHLRCNDCGVPWPSTPVSMNPAEFPKMFAVLNQLNFSIGTVNINTVNNFMGGSSGEDTFLDTYEADGLVLFQDPDQNALFLKSLQGTDAPLSDFVFSLFKDEFHCCKAGVKGTDGMWYHYNKHRWEPKAELTLRQRLGEDEFFIRYFKLALRYYERECIQTEDTKRKVRNLKRVIEQLSDTGRRKRILEDSIERFHVYRPTFAEDLDVSNRLVFSNGVFDYSTFEFRDGRPDDLVSIALKFQYQPMDQGSADCKTVMDFMSSIQPDVATRDYLLTLMSLCTSVDTTMQHFWIFTGKGANGKSKLMNLLMEALSDHYGTAPAALLTRRREDANQANESLSALEKCRVAVFSEGSAAEILQVNTIKLFTGEDVITTRGLHEKQRRWKPKFKCILVCNDIPKLDDSSWSAWRRIKVVHFPTSYVDNPVRDHERQKDPLIGEKLSRCLWAFVAILVEYYRRFKTVGLVESEAITKATEKYQTENDVFEEYSQDHIMEEQGARLESKELISDFREWASRGKKKIPANKDTLTALIETKLGKIYRNNWNQVWLTGWRNYRLVENCGCCKWRVR